MAKIILNDGTEEYLSPGAAQAKVTAGKAKWPTADQLYSTRQLVAEPVKNRRKRKPKKVEAVVEEEKVEEETVEPEQVDTDEVE